MAWAKYSLFKCFLHTCRTRTPRAHATGFRPVCLCVCIYVIADVYVHVHVCICICTYYTCICTYRVRYGIYVYAQIYYGVFAPRLDLFCKQVRISLSLHPGASSQVAKWTPRLMQVGALACS